MKKKSQLREAFPKRLRKLMKDRRLSVTAFAEKLGYARSSVSRWLKGGIPQSSLDWYRIAKFFGVTMEYMAGREPINPNDEIALTRGQQDRNIPGDFIAVAFNRVADFVRPVLDTVPDATARTDAHAALIMCSILTENTGNVAWLDAARALAQGGPEAVAQINRELYGRAAQMNLEIAARACAKLSPGEIKAIVGHLQTRHLETQAGGNIKLTPFAQLWNFVKAELENIATADEPTSAQESVMES